jgi:shikimate kinase
VTAEGKQAQGWREAGRTTAGGDGPLAPSSACPRVFLIGARGSGKTTVARLLAARLGWSCVDADEALEQRAGYCIRALFAGEGEDAFRDREGRILEELAGLHRHVIATGGGVVLRPANRDLLRRGFVVWLTADVETLYNRIQGDATTSERRPNLAAGGPAEVAEVLRLREPLYRACADLVISTAGRPPEEIVSDVLAALCGGE